MLGRKSNQIILTYVQGKPRHLLKDVFFPLQRKKKKDYKLFHDNFTNHTDGKVKKQKSKYAGKIELHLPSKILSPVMAKTSIWFLNAGRVTRKNFGEKRRVVTHKLGTSIQS